MGDMGAAGAGGDDDALAPEEGSDSESDSGPPPLESKNE